MSWNLINRNNSIVIVGSWRWRIGYRCRWSSPSCPWLFFGVLRKWDSIAICLLFIIDTFVIVVIFVEIVHLDFRYHWSIVLVHVVLIILLLLLLIVIVFHVILLLLFVVLLLVILSFHLMLIIFGVVIVIVLTLIVESWQLVLLALRLIGYEIDLITILMMNNL